MEGEQQQEEDQTTQQQDEDYVSGDGDDQDFREVFSFGQNSYCELGHSDTQEICVPTAVAFCQDKAVIQVVAGNEHTAILCESGDVYTCGYNDSGQCGVGNTGRVSQFSLVPTLRGKGVVNLFSANGCEHLAAITESGELYTCGYNARGQLGHGTTTHMPVPRPVAALRGKHVVRVSCSYYHSMVTTDCGEVYAFGRNDYGQLGLGDYSDKHTPRLVEALAGYTVTALAAGQYHTVLAVDGGGVFAFGKNDYGQLGLDSPEPKALPTVVSGPLSEVLVVQIACGYYHTVCRTARGKVTVFGRNDYGQLGIGSRDHTRIPQTVGALEGQRAVQIATGCYHTAVLTESGGVYTFGRNNHGQLGTGSTTDAALPQPVTALAGHRVAQVAAGFYHTICLTGPPLDSQRVPRPKSTLAADLRQLLNNPARSDVTFIAESKPVFAHRCILMVRCAPLECMLDGPMRESRQQEIVMHDIRFPVLCALLEFLYTDTVEALNTSQATNGTDGTAGTNPAAAGPNVDAAGGGASDNGNIHFCLDLLSAADQFLVDSLKRQCEAAIQKSIQVDNVSLMLSIAAQRQASGLRKRCVDFIMRHFGKVIGTKAFAELPQELLHEILTAASKRGVCLQN